MKFKKEIRYISLALTAFLGFLAIYLSFIYTPPHAVMGNVQRIFYFHVEIGRAHV